MGCSAGGGEGGEGCSGGLGGGSACPWAVVKGSYYETALSTNLVMVSHEHHAV